MLPCLRCLAVFILVLPYATGFAQSVADLVKAPPAPETMEAQNMPADYRAVHLKLAGSDASSSWMQSITLSMMFSGSGSPRTAEYALFEMSTISWTSGQTLKTDKGEFLVTYKLALDSMAKPGNTSRTLRLSLIRSDSIIEIDPRPDITKERLLRLVQPEIATATGDSRNVATSNMKQLALGAIMYQTDWDDLLPYAQETKTTFAVIHPYVKDTSVFKSTNPLGSRILYNIAIGGVSPDQIGDPSATVLFYEEKAWPDGRRLVAFADGHVLWADEERWQRVRKTLNLKLKHSAKPLPPAYWKKLNPQFDIGL